MRVFLTGATGFVGSNLLRRLLRNGHLVRALVRRRGVLAGAESGSLEEVEGDILSPNLAIAGCHAVINLVGIIYEHGHQTFDAVHHLGTRNLINAAQKNGVQRFVQMSALGARPGNATEYHTSKFAAEEEVRNSGVPWVVLRPSLIFGPGSAFLRQMVGIMRAAPLFRPVAGTGKYRFRPIHVDDVADCFVASLTNAEANGKTIDLVGAEEVTLNEITDEIASCLNLRKTAVHIPMPLMKIAASVFSILPVKSPVTSVQLRMLEEGSTADPGPMKKIFGIEPIGFRAGLRRDLCKAQENQVL
ncbi:MAG TPA: complex I NDUFA9 subunit family protein [Terriglobales bacterium]|nr:complex I NDUFA9 subunit family protein [Terriglobales bacterium]